ncbi:hypothetical protein FOZ60_016120 [Perkinsus olseni]|uniref:Ubiquitin-like protease family profile domain-containing protein n=1 Tax=Perkinsus olseni TaxID=32597 RepID=A0A7J6P508_PEROL|nr:hypothetical protein FOZ60_016120 [Perkinsus olseni]
MFHSAQKHLRDRRPRCFYNILALAFLPTHLVPAGLLVGCKELDTADYDFMASYLSQYYTRPNAVFPVEEWNMRDRVLSGLCRSTNSQEAFHRVWGKEVGVNPNIWEWIENTARFIAKQRVKVGNLDRGDRPRRKNYYEVTDASIHALVNLPVDEASLESWFQSARTNLRRLTPPGGDEVRPEIDPFPYPWEEATLQTATTGPVFRTMPLWNQNTWQSSANDGGNFASPAAESGESHFPTCGIKFLCLCTYSWSILLEIPPLLPLSCWGLPFIVPADLADLGREGTSLSDSVVDFWMSLLVARKKLSPPRRRLRLDHWPAAVTSTTLFMQPLFDSAENHFACTVVKRGRIYYCDSSCMSSQPSNGMMGLLRRIYGAEAEVTVLPVQQQTPMSALCAAYTLAFCTEFLLGGVQPGKVNLRESDMRNHIMACVEERRAKQFPRMLPRG